jgi:hypothetical protein
VSLQRTTLAYCDQLTPSGCEAKSRVKQGHTQGNPNSSECCLRRPLSDCYSDDERCRKSYSNNERLTLHRSGKCGVHESLLSLVNAAPLMPTILVGITIEASKPKCNYFGQQLLELSKYGPTIPAFASMFTATTTLLKQLG